MPTSEAQLTGILERGERAYKRLARTAQRHIDRLAIWRIALFLVLLVAFSFMVSGSYQAIGGATFLVALIAFVGLMIRHDRLYRHHQSCQVRCALVTDDLHRLNGDLSAITIDQPLDFPPEHRFAHDLDFTGDHGLLKLLDYTHLPSAKRIVHGWIDHQSDVAEVVARQNAVAELAEKSTLRMRIRAKTRNQSSTHLDEHPTWLDSPTPLSAQSWLLWPTTALGLVASTLLIMRFVLQMAVPWLPLTVLASVGFALTGYLQRALIDSFMTQRRPIETTAVLAALLQNQHFSSAPLAAIDRRLRETRAVQQLGRLNRLMDAFGFRANALAHFIMNFCVQWDAWHVRQLCRWRADHGANLEPWFEALSQFEALSSLAQYAWLFPSYCYPELIEGHGVQFEATDLGHPLIARPQRVCNDYQIKGTGQIHLLTGSNMSGKSTFLRTVGANWILATMGVPVCAKTFSCSMPQIWTSIRIQDSLNQGVSFFYAEVLRLKAILQATAGQDRPVFFLLDEILRGTNSRERLIACKAAVNYFAKNQASGILTTHDLELLALANSHPGRVHKFHFRETMVGDEMTFDYQLHPDELTSTNALRVMRAAGLPLDFEEP